MFCSSLRKRSEWATVPATLLSEQQPRWLENTLDGHDLALPLPNADQQMPPDFFRLVLLSPCDLHHLETTMARIEKLYHKYGGRNVGVMFLLNEKLPKENGTIAFMSLQASMFPNFEIPTLPLSMVPCLTELLFTFQHQLVNQQRKPPLAQGDPAIALLPFCTTRPPMPEHIRNVLSDICDDLPNLSQAATTEDGQQALRQYLSDINRPEICEEILSYWQEEFLVD